jgi:hypothetical protein
MPSIRGAYSGCGAPLAIEVAGLFAAAAVAGACVRAASTGR